MCQSHYWCALPTRVAAHIHSGSLDNQYAASVMPCGATPPGLYNTHTQGMRVESLGGVWRHRVGVTLGDFSSTVVGHLDRYWPAWRPEERLGPECVGLKYGLNSV